MRDRHLHIVSFNIPFPPNYGGVIDVYYKIRSLKQAGVKVHLHCYNHGREQSPELEAICESVHYYPIRWFYQSIFSRVPNMIGSRQSDDLLNRLGEDDHPILFEGLHTCAYLSHPMLQDRLKAVRLHHVEWDYYRSLGKAERNFFRKFYYYQESKKLKEFEFMLNDADKIFAITKKDYNDLKKEHTNVAYIPAFHSNEEMSSQSGRGDYVLYHGNLQVIENNQAAIYLIGKVFAGSGIRFVIAGRNPLPTLKRLVNKHPNVELVENPEIGQLEQLVQDAHINILTAFQPTGPKLKLLNALFNGRFCIANSRMVQYTGLEKLCHVENDHNKMKKLIATLMEKDFTSAHLTQRARYLLKNHANSAYTNELIKQLYPAHQQSALAYSA